jgi:CBS domain-containing protein
MNNNQVTEVMTTDVHVVPPDCTIADAAIQMKDLDIGALPVCDGERLLGMITDRDIALKAVATGCDPLTTTVQEMMTAPIVFCFDGDDVEDAARIMESRKVRRLVVLNKEKRLVGIVSLGDIAVKSGQEYLAGEILERVSEPVRGQPRV